MATSMKELWELYQTYVKENPQSVSQLEGVTRVLSYIIPAKLKSSEVVSELLYSASNLLVLLNDTILRNAARAYSKTPTKQAKLKSWLAVVECLEVFLEIGAEKAGGPTLHWIVVVCIQILKTVVRFLILKTSPRGLQTTPAIPSLNRKKDHAEQLDPPIQSDDQDDVISLKKNPSVTFTLQRSGRTVRSITAAPSMVHRTWKLPTEDSTLGVQRRQPTELSPQQQLAEGLYISRPLVHLLGMLAFGQKSWRPWFVAAGVDISSLYMMGDRNVFNSVEKAELRRRTTMLIFYMLRSPFYDTFTKKRLLRLMVALTQTIPGIGLIVRPLIAYLPTWQKIYFYVWNQ